MHSATSTPPPDTGALFRAHAPFVAGFLAKMGVPEAERDDLVQDVFMTAHRRGGWTPGAAKATTWLAEIAIRLVANRRRKVQRRTDALERLPSRAAAPEPAEVLEQRRAVERVDRALETLDVKKRGVFVLFELEGESCEDIAAALGVPVGTVYSRLHAARRDFLAAYERETAPKRRLQPLRIGRVL
jgi:RNA polymerase sigma-70 factor (ECF subfamily)